MRREVTLEISIFIKYYVDIFLKSILTKTPICQYMPIK